MSKKDRVDELYVQAVTIASTEDDVALETFRNSLTPEERALLRERVRENIISILAAWRNFHDTIYVSFIAMGTWAENFKAKLKEAGYDFGEDFDLADLDDHDPPMGCDTGPS